MQLRYAIMDKAKSAQTRPYPQKWQQLLEEAQYRWQFDTAELAGVQNLAGLARLLHVKFGLSTTRAEAEAAGLAELFARRVQRAA